MKYLLTKVIQELKSSEVRFFKVHTSKYQQKGSEKRTVELFHELRNGEVDEYGPKIQEQLFGKKNNNGYYRVKNRLRKEVEGALLTLNQHNKDENGIFDDLKLANIFMEKSLFAVAKEYLENAEKAALELNMPHLMNLIYEKFIQLADLNPELDAAVYEAKKKSLS